MHKTARISVDQIQPDPEQPRKLFDEAGLMALAANMGMYGQLVPVIVFLVNQVVILLDGERRWRAAKLGGIKELTAIVLQERPSTAQLRTLQASLDVHRATLSPMERSNLLVKIRDETKLSVGELAEKVNMSQPLVSKLLAFQRLETGIRNLLHTGGLDMEKAYSIAQEPDEARQLQLVNESAGLSREQLRARVKRKTDQPKAKRAVFALPGGMSVTVAGIEVTLEDAIERLTEIVKELRRGLSQGLDISTQQKVMRDKARV